MEDNAVSRGRLARAEELAARAGTTAGQVALAYVRGQAFPAIPIVGNEDVGHLREAIAAMSIHLTADEVRWLREG